MNFFYNLFDILCIRCMTAWGFERQKHRAGKH